MIICYFNDKMDKENKYLSSLEAMKYLKISSCDLMHLRIDGKLGFTKRGNAFLYEINDIKKTEKTNVKGS